MGRLKILCPPATEIILRWRFWPAIICIALPLWSQTPILTERYDSSRTGANLSETLLNTSNVNVGQFGLLYSYTIDGSIQAQPLYVPNLTIPGLGTFNVLFIVTMNDVIYAFNADRSSPNGGVLWTRDLRNPAAGITPIAITDIVGANNLNIVGNVGIESTPAIDLGSSTMYLVARTKEVSGSTTNYVTRLHALDITTGNEKFGGPVTVNGSVAGTGQGSSSGTLTFDPFIENQRSSLALVNGTIVFAFASHEDDYAWHGWVFAYDSQTLQQKGIYCATPNGKDGGIWMAGRAPVVDASGNVYYATGNGDWDGTTNFGDSVIKLSAASGVLSLLDYFTPDSFATLNANDLDLGSSGPLLIPGTDLLLHTGKDSIVRVMHTSSMGHERSGNGQIVQNFSTTGGQVRGGMVLWNRTTGAGPTMYVWPDESGLIAFQFNGTNFNTAPLDTSSIVAPNGNSGGVLTLSANGNTPGTGIVWSSMPLSADGDHGTHQGVLRAFDAEDLSNELWNSTINVSRDNMGLWPKYSPPTVVNGKVYMASFSNFLNVYGLLPPPTPPTVYIDVPAAGATVSGSVGIWGWAVDESAGGTAISSVQVKVDGTFVGTATYGSSRADVCAAGAYPGCPNVGFSFSLNTSTLTAGIHTVTATATDSDTTPDSGSYSLSVNVQTPPPNVHIDVPGPAATVSGNVGIWGWAVDASAAGTAISSVQINVDGTVVGTASYGSSRPDVCAAGTYSGCPNVGFSFSLNTSTLGPGTHTITATAADSDATPDSGSYSVTVNVQATPPPTVHIDVPSSGATVSGTIGIWGWAVDASAAGTAISSVQIKVDGTVVGTATYGSSRADVCAAGTYSGCPNVGFSFSLNTSTLSLGTHTITATAADSDATPDSGFFSISVSVTR